MFFLDFYEMDISFRRGLAETKNEIGNELYKTERYQEAIESYTESIGLSPNVASYYGNRAACYMMLEQFTEALEDARKSIAVNSSFVKGYIRISKCCLSLGNVSAAGRALDKVFELDPNNPAIETEKRTIKTIKRLLEDGERAYANKNYQKVIYYMDCVLEQLPCQMCKIRKEECLALIAQLAESWKEDGNQLYKTERYQHALASYTAAIDLCPNVASYYGNRAACYMSLLKYEEALKDARKSISLDSSFVKGYLRISKCCLALGDLSAAETALDKVVELDPNNPAIAPEKRTVKTINRLMKDGERAYANKNYQKVVYYMDRVLEHLPCQKCKIRKSECLALIAWQEEKLKILKLAETKNEYGNQLYKTEKYQEAIESYTEAIGLSTNVASYYGNRAACYMMLQQNKEALKDARKSVAVDNSFVKGYIRISKCCLSLGDLSAAETAVDKIVELDPKNPEIALTIRKFKTINKFVKDGESAYANGNYHHVVYCMDRVLELMACPKCKIRKEECLALIAQYEEAQKRIKLAETKNENGNQFYNMKRYKLALASYTEAICLGPNVASFYGNRAACYMMLQQYKEALKDARKSIDVDNSYVKGYIRISKCCLSLGDLSAAETALDQVFELDPKNREVAHERRNIRTIKYFMESGEKAYTIKNYPNAVYYMDRVLKLLPCPRCKILKAECLAFMGQYQEAEVIANKILQINKQNADAKYVLGICLYYQDNVDEAFTHFQNILSLARDHAKVLDFYQRAKALKLKKEAGDNACENGRLEKAYDLYTEALKNDLDNKSINSNLFLLRATVSTLRGKCREAISDCTSALALDPRYLQALLYRAKCNMNINNFEEAISGYESAVKMDDSRENIQLLTAAKLALKRSMPNYYYTILGIEKIASPDEVKQAYKKRALEFHPDRHAGASDDEKKELESMFKEVGEAYGVLSDPDKRAQYDRASNRGAV